ncbi:sodium:proton antiporter [Amycolatopsis sp. BJA-103]|uniref:cation:proton antiporter n=1 Tax=Amycolatopsis sp. BJA-103 TaxID=1911175 RepID=UPI001E58F2F2|nr:cation:proton antiporter [Amycolatopsis sp. BJA-103]
MSHFRLRGVRAGYSATMEILLAGAGVLALCAAVLPNLLHERALSMPLILLVGGLIFGLLPFGYPYGEGVLDPRSHVGAVEVITELGVLVSLVGAGLKSDRLIGWRSWSSTWRLLAITLPLSIGAVALLGWWALALSPAAALLLGAVLAPTDPVLASDVQVPAPHTEDGRGSDNEIRFTLTSEAGLNDGLAMPFVLLAVVLAGTVSTSPVPWLLTEVIVPLAIAVVVGLVCGRLLSWLMFRVRHERLRLGEYSDGLVVLAIAFLPFALCEWLGGIGFVAVFATAATIRASERSHDYHGVLHEFGDQLERLFVALALLGLGFILGDGLLADLQVAEVLVAVAAVVVVRPLFGGLALFRGGITRPAATAIAFFGIRGIGSLYYLSYALGHGDFPMADSLWRVTALTIAVSVLVHGLLSGPVMRKLENRGMQNFETG